MDSRTQWVVVGWLVGEREEAEPRVLAQCGEDEGHAKFCVASAVGSGSFESVYHVRADVEDGK